MVESKVNNFYKASSDFFAKRNALKEELYDLVAMHDAAKYALIDTIDNGIDESYVISIAKKYHKSKFEDADVCRFIDYIIDDVLKWTRCRLQVTSLEISYFGSSLENSSFALNLCDINEWHFFRVHIPVKSEFSKIHAIQEQMSSYVGMYVVDAYAWTKDISTKIINNEICRSFDSLDVAKSIEMYLSVKSDNICSLLSLVNKQSSQYFSEYDLSCKLYEDLIAASSEVSQMNIQNIAIGQCIADVHTAKFAKENFNGISKFED